MADTANLILPLMAAAQSQKHVTHNEAILRLDVLAQLAVKSTTLTAPPGSPADGDRYLIASGPTGAWAGKDLNITYYSSGAWVFLPPREGWLCWDEVNDILLVWTGSAWSDYAQAGGFVTNTTLSAGNLTAKIKDANFTLTDNGDTTKALRFELAAISTAATRILNVQNLNGTVALTDQTQTWSGSITFSNATLTFGSSTAAGTISIGTGATVAAATKTINVGTSGVATSVTNLTFGSAVAGALGTTTFNTPTVTFGPNVTAIGAAAANLSALYAGLGGATADATNRLSIDTPAVLFNNAGAGINATVNKATVGNDASFTFQTAFSTRALFGLLADDRFTAKVSPNGSTFYTGFILDGTGRMGLGNNLPSGSFAAPLHIQDSGTFQPQVLLVSTANDTSGPYWNSRKARNGSSTNAGDPLGTYVFQGMGTNGLSTNSSFISVQATHIGTTWVASSFIFNMTDTVGSAFTALQLSSSRDVRFPSVGTTASAANAFLDVNNTLLKSTSSARYKTDIEDLDVKVAYKVLRQARPVWYRSLAKADRSDWSWYGFLAEDVGALDPRLVTWSVPEEDCEVSNVELLPAGAAGAGEPMMTKVAVPKSGALPKPDGVMYERFVVMHQRVLLDLLERIENLESKLA